MKEEYKNHLKLKNSNINIKNMFYNKKSEYLLETFPEFFNNNFLNFFLKNKNLKWDNKTKDKKIKIPEIFSLVENFDETMKVINEITTIYFSLRSMILDFSKCFTFDFATSALMTVILLNLENSREKNKIYFNIHLVGNNTITNDLFINGIGEYLNITKPGSNKQKDYLGEAKKTQKEKFKNLQLMGGGETTIEFQTKLINRELFIPSYMGETIEKPVIFINESLKTKGFSLNPKGAKKFKEIIGEIINNSRIHLGKEFSQYFLIGNYINSEIGKGSLLFFNFGNTIYETFKNTKSEEMKKTINNMKELYNQKRYFDDDFTEETLLTLLAIQDKISSEYTLGENRGTGITKMIRNFLTLSNFNVKENPPKTYIISGHTKIKLDGNLKKKNDETNIFALNEQGSLEYKPDIEKVKFYKNFYPGTMILVEFNIDEEWLKKKEKENEKK